jgi:single-strand selective monofunctional uracil DNA glycosylase
VRAAQQLSAAVEALSFGPPVTHVYNPLCYAWPAHREYLSRVPDGGVRVLLLGMNPGPWGMAQTGVPFGEVAAVRDWLGIQVAVDRPPHEHPRRPVEGFHCRRSEVSGRRLWGLFRDRFGTADAFFVEHFVANYCPLVFMEASGRNRTPDKLPAKEREPLSAACDSHLLKLLDALRPQFVVGVGGYAEKCLQRVLPSSRGEACLTGILHPSPASPAANRDWAGQVTAQLIAAGIW